MTLGPVSQVKAELDIMLRCMGNLCPFEGPHAVPVRRKTPFHSPPSPFTHEGHQDQE